MKKTTKNQKAQAVKKDSPRRKDSRTWAYKGFEIVRDGIYLIFNPKGMFETTVDDYFAVKGLINKLAPKA